MRNRNPKATVMVYPTGTISCLGAQSVEKAKDASKKIAKVIKNLGFEVKFGNFRVMNICAHGNIGFKIFLQRMWKENLNFEHMNRKYFQLCTIE